MAVRIRRRVIVAAKRALGPPAPDRDGQRSAAPGPELCNTCAVSHLRTDKPICTGLSVSRGEHRVEQIDGSNAHDSW